MNVTWITLAVVGGLILALALARRSAASSGASLYRGHRERRWKAWYSWKLGVTVVAAVTAMVAIFSFRSQSRSPFLGSVRISRSERTGARRNHWMRSTASDFRGARRSWELSDRARSEDGHGRSTRAGQSIVPNDVSDWRRDDVLPFRSVSGATPSWVEEGLDARVRPELVEGRRIPLVDTVDGRWVVGYSAQQPDAETALSEALAAARAKLAWLALAEVQRQWPSGDVRLLRDLAWRGVEDLDVEPEAHREIAPRPYGRVHRAAVALPVDRSTLLGLAQVVKERTRSANVREIQSVRRAFALAFILGSLLIVVTLGGIFVRAGRLGVWALPLRLVAGTVIAGAVAVGYVLTMTALRVP